MTAEQRAEQIYHGNTIEEEAYKNGWYDGVEKACEIFKKCCPFGNVDSFKREIEE